MLGARTNEEAKKIAKQIVGSSLVKTAIHGEDPNWGRIISSIGQSEVVINPNTIDITLQSISVLKIVSLKYFLKKK